LAMPHRKTDCTNDNKRCMALTGWFITAKIFAT
jgi:hypothetical protein